MTNFLVEDFKLGLDLRKDALTAQPGSLRQLDNAVITPGGEIEKRKAFVQVATLPAGVFGMYGYPVLGPNINRDYGLAEGTYPEGVLYYIKLNPGSGSPATTTLGTVRFQEHWVTLPLGDVVLPATANFGGAAAFGQITGPPNYYKGLYVSARLIVSGATPGQWYNFYEGVNIPAAADQIFPTTIGQKMYRGTGYTVFFSGVGDPTDNNPLNPAGTGPNTTHPGAGFIQLSNLDSQFGGFTGFGAYYRQTAVFGYTRTLLFSFDPDPSQNVMTQIIGVGCVGGMTVCPFGTGELIFCAPEGVRLMRALNASMTASISDIGAPVDKLIAPEVLVSPLGGRQCQAILEPQTGRYWLAVGSHIYVLNYWPSAKIAAWSRFVLPFNVDSLVTVGRYVFVRSGTALYLYGGLTLDVYDTSPATVVTPYHSTGTPNIKKKTKSVHAMVRGNWAMSLSLSPDQAGFYEAAVNLSSPSYTMQELPFAGYGTHVGFKFTTTDASPALLGAAGVRFDKANEV